MKLTSDQESRRQSIVERLRVQREVIEARVDDFNGAASTAWDRVRLALEDYESVRTEAEELRDEVVSDGESAISDKSEKWQEGEKGQAASSWVEEWSGLDLEEIELEEPDEIEIPDLSHADDLEALPETDQ